MTAEENLQLIIYELEMALPDARKADEGNKSAGTRVRKVAYKSLFDLKSLRSNILEIRKNGKRQK